MPVWIRIDRIVLRRTTVDLKDDDWAEKAARAMSPSTAADTHLIASLKTIANERGLTGAHEVREVQSQFRDTDGHTRKETYIEIA